ncbi:SH3 domain-binding protein 5-like [Salvelinus alpinus]
MEKLENGIKPVKECESPEDEVVDPRIQGELDRLNQSTEDINRWETELEDCRQRFRAVLVEATVKLDEQVKRIGRAVEDSKPYWEARREARQGERREREEEESGREEREKRNQGERRRERRGIRERGEIEEESGREEREEESEREEREKRETANHYNACISHMRQLEKKLKRTINKSRPYFELKSKYYLNLEQLKRCVDEHQAKLTVAKAGYRTALRNLETISEEIHARRCSITMGTRGRGVGAEGEGSHEDITNFKMESDGLSMVSVTFDEEGGSEEETESHSTSAPLDMTSSSHHPSSSFTPSAYLSSAPSLLSSSCPSTMEGPSPGGWLSPESRCGSGHDCPHLGPRSQCSGASSPDPDCDQERGNRAEGAEQKLEPGLSRLTLTITHPLHPGKDDPKGDPKTTSPSPHNP